MDLEYYRNDDQTAEVVKSKCLDALNDIKWSEQVNFTPETTINDAIELALQGLDGGMEGTYQLQPDGLQFHEWMQYAYLCTILYNRNRSLRRYTILRKCFNHACHELCYNREFHLCGRIIPAFRYNSVIIYYLYNFS